MQSKAAVQSPVGDLFRFSVLVRVVDEAALTETAESLVEGCGEWSLAERVEFVVINPANPPLDCGYELKSVDVREQQLADNNPLVAPRTFIVSVSASVHNAAALEREAVNQWRGARSRTPSIATPVDQLYEVLVVSNEEAPAGWIRGSDDGRLMPQKRGFEVIEYRPTSGLRGELSPDPDMPEDAPAAQAPGM